MGKYTPRNVPYENVIVARQPIFDRMNEVWGYELLYRASSEDGIAIINDPEFASMLVATCGFLQQAESTNISRRTSINFTEKLINELAPQALPPTVTVVEVLESVLPSPEVQQSLITLKQDGYLIAVDDYVGETDKNELLELADVIKVDVLGRTREELAEILSKINHAKVLLVAERVDNNDTRKMCLELGFDLFQGFFYAMPHNIEGKKIPSSAAMKARLMQVIQEEGDDIDAIVQALKIDPSIGYRLLRYINSPAFGFSTEIDTIKRASDMLGIKRLSRWLQLVIMSDIVPKEKTVELYRCSLERAKFFELLCLNGRLDLAPDAGFTFGLFSLLEALFDMEMDNILEQLPLGDTLKGGYLDEASDLNRYLQLLLNIEQNDMDGVIAQCDALNISVEEVSRGLLEATTWADKIFSVVAA
ncbi:HDOD domain-containing protein [Pseudodesulfovibrio cashew]|uniref:HDOD domain-containing protein n=1 Tax=Pseudodesulfovibrio cashew TaxID=2678688 RepID=A0A6I6JL21_9BACT|nr:EAL domain-containing protein [Pseudodesulfovibrio cashew]QGY41678.1 HDOD domain-containing protein [Pseudodesulfovibrio cashew]